MTNDNDKIIKGEDLENKKISDEDLEQISGGKMAIKKLNAESTASDNSSF